MKYYYRILQTHHARTHSRTHPANEKAGERGRKSENEGLSIFFHRQGATITRDILIPGPTQPGLSQNRQNVIWVPLSLSLRRDDEQRATQLLEHF